MAEQEAESAPERFDVLRYPDDSHRAVPAGDGQRVVVVHEREADRQKFTASAASGLIGAAVVGLGATLVTAGLVVPLAAGVVGCLAAAVGRARYWTRGDKVPDLVVSDASARVAEEYVENFDPAEVNDPFESASE